MIQAITFDFWDTLFVDDSDEPARAARGLPPKPEARRELFVSEVLAHHPAVGRPAAEAAFAGCNERFRHHWKVEHHTPHIRDRLANGFTALGLGPSAGFDALVDAFAHMEVRIPPRPAEGALACLEALAGTYRLGIISDAIVTPGSGLRQILDGAGMLGFFDHFVFSDEAGAAKPAPRVVELACKGLQVAPGALVHVGDREANDVVGPVRAGAHAILYTGVIDRGSAATTEADAVCTHHRELPGLVAGLKG